MNFLCDVHISIKISKRLEELGHESIHVNNILDKWHTKDSEIANYANENNLTLITKDQDFRNSFILNGNPMKLIKINLGNIPNKNLMDIIERNINTFKNVHDQNEQFMIEINEHNFLITTK